MTGQRPTTITLKSGHVLTTTEGSLDWTCAPVVPGRTDKAMNLRDLIERIAHEPGTDAAYGLDLRHGAFAVTYAILDEVRAAHGSAFAWSVVTPDATSLMILDELDDLCCESRVWGHGGGLQARITKMVGDKPWETRAEPTQEEHFRGLALLRDLAERHNAGIGFGPKRAIPVKPLKAAVYDEYIVLSNDTGNLFAFKGPRELGPREHAIAAQLVALAA